MGGDLLHQRQVGLSSSREVERVQWELAEAKEDAGGVGHVPDLTASYPAVKPLH